MPQTSHQASTNATRAIAFDWGGVFTVGTFDGRSTQRLADQYQLDLTLVRQHYFQLVHKLELGQWNLGEFWQEFGANIGLGAVPYEDFEKLYLGSIFENQAMYDYLPSIPDSLKVGLLSNNYPTICEQLEQDPRWARFDCMVFSNKIGVKKPDPLSFQALVESLGLPPAQIVFVDDVQENLDAAQALGLAGILYDAHAHDRFLEQIQAWIAHA